MMSRIMPAIAVLLDEPGYQGTKNDVAEKVHCDPKTAARILMDLHVHRNIYVVDWLRERGGPIPIYAKRTAGQEDKPKLIPRSKLPFKHRDPEAIYGKRKERAMTNKVLSGDIRLGVWGL